MKLEVPFVRQENEYDCGAANLSMALKFFGEDRSIEELSQLFITDRGKPVWTVELGLAASELGFDADFYTSKLGFKHSDKEWYREETEGKHSEVFRAAKDSTVSIREEEFELDELLGFLEQDAAVIVLVDWNVVDGKDGYRGHFVTLTGFDDENVFFNNSANTSGKDTHVSRQVFDRARKSEGTDQDFVVFKN